MSVLGAGLVAYGGAPSSTVSAHVLLIGVQTGPLALAGTAVEICAVVWYAAAVRRLSKQGRPWSPYATAAFVAGVLSIWVAVGSGLAAYDEVNVTAHVIQHLVLMMVAPPLVALGQPITLASQAAHRRTQVALLAIVHSRTLATLTFPVLTWFAYYGTMYAFFENRNLYDYSINHPYFHDATHLVFFAVGYLYWQPLVGGDPTRWRLPIVVRAGSIFLGMPFEAFLGISISEVTIPIDPINTLANTRAAGETFWVAAMFLSGLCLASVGLQLFRQLGKDAPREDRWVEAHTAEFQARAEQLGMQDLPEGWTVPLWRLAELEDRQKRSRPPQPPEHNGPRPPQPPEHNGPGPRIDARTEPDPTVGSNPDSG